MTKSLRRAYARPALWRRVLRLLWRTLRVVIIAVGVLGPSAPPPPPPRIPPSERRAQDEEPDEDE